MTGRRGRGIRPAHTSRLSFWENNAIQEHVLKDAPMIDVLGKMPFSDESCLFHNGCSWSEGFSRGD